MSRRMNTGARGRQTYNSGGRPPSIKLTFGGKSGRKNGSKEITTLTKSTQKRRKAAVPSDDEDSTTSGGFSDDNFDEVDEESEEADDESEDPEAEAPSHHPILRGGSGLPGSNEDLVDMPDNGEWVGFPEPKSDDIQIELFKDVDLGDMERRLLESDDDDMVYERVNEVSDSDDDDDDAIERVETDLLTAEFDEDLTSHFANQIEGMSAYGFGSESDDDQSVCFPFSSSDEANEASTRRVHFEEEPPVGIANAFAALADSPTMTRALLPSALPDNSGMNAGTEALSHDAENPDYDTDATEELPTPAQTWHSTSTSRKNSMTEKSTASSSPPAKRVHPQKGPVRGTFHDNGDKVTAILDPSGTRLVIQDPHLLGGIFARRFGPSVPASPSVGFSDAVFGESDSSQASGSPRPESAQLSAVDPMFSGLISGDNAATNGQATGLPEAFMSADQSFLNDFISTDLFDNTEFDPESTLRIEDMIAFDGDDDDDAADSPMPLMFAQQETMSAPNTPLPHLSSLNVTAFKRNAECPTYFSSPQPDPLKHRFATPLKRKQRPAKYDSPYNDSHYNGVTPVQRITYHELSSSPAPSSSKMHKRRRTMF